MRAWSPRCKPTRICSVKIIVWLTKPLSPKGRPMMTTRTNGRPQKATPGWTIVQHKLLSILEHPEHQQKSPGDICQLAGYGEWAWERAIKDPRFVDVLRQLKHPAVPPARG